MQDKNGVAAACYLFFIPDKHFRYTEKHFLCTGKYDP